MKKNKINFSWFTLIELMVSVAIIGIIALWSTSLNFNKLSNREKLKINNNKIVSTIETIRNNSLMWKWIWVNLINPKYWRIDFSKVGSWKILVSYNTGGLDINFTEKNIIFNNWYYIDSVICSNLSWTFNNNTLSWVLFISWDNITWSGASLCNDTRTKKLEIITWYRNLTWSILINTVSWLIEQN